MIKTFNVSKEDILKQVEEKLDEICVDSNLEIDVDEALISDLAQRDIEVFTKKAALLNLISALQEDM